MLCVIGLLRVPPFYRLLEKSERMFRFVHRGVTEALIKAGADVDQAMPDGRTPLMIAAQGGHE